ncbi:MAG: ABC transporter ATP-binding protein [Planctomycetales bacterium]|nr:ABC transporter ATP-binding protein [Planctomycetales bacterium]
MVNVSFGYGTGPSRHEVFRRATLEIAENEFVAVMGFSGSGKSTLMAILAGLLMAEAGEVRWQGQTNPVAGQDRGIVFQNYSLLPWLTVAGNIELAVRQVWPRRSRRGRRDYVQQWIDTVNLSGSERKRPHELSGGMRQRLALARTLAMQPKVLLLDEPLSALDALTRAVLQDEIIELWQRDRRTIVMVTNDIDEALLMADRIVPLTPGPAASFGRDFHVELPRPRCRGQLNFDPQFRSLRNDITRAMLGMRAKGNNTLPSPRRSPPEIRPVLPGLNR